jgi:hypothetical protein
MEQLLGNKEMETAKEAGIRFYFSPEEKESAYLKEGLVRTDKERFLFLLNLIRLERLMKRAKFHTK